MCQGLARAFVLLQPHRVFDSTVRQVLERQPEIAVDLENHSVRSFQVPTRHGNGYIYIYIHIYIYICIYIYIYLSNIL